MSAGKVVRQPLNGIKSVKNGLWRIFLDGDGGVAEVVLFGVLCVVCGVAPGGWAGSW
jgi:hypothetical protein